jgi:hypothetical protein
MKHASTRWAICFLIACGISGAASASRTRTFRIGGDAAFSKAELNGVSVAEDGTVSPGPAAALLVPEAGAQVWSLCRTRDGVIYAGSGSDGIVYRVKGEKAEKAAELFEYEIFSIVEGEKGRVFASGAPNGTIAELHPDGTVTTLFDTPEKIVWSLIADREGNLYAGTGDRGYVYRISPDGKASVLYRGEDSHVGYLEWTKEGKIVAATGGRGLLMEIDPKSGQAKVLYDAREPEITRLAVGPAGEIYFAAAGSGDLESGAPEDGDVKTEPVEKSDGTSLYLRAPDGTVRLVWACPEKMIHSLCFDGSGNLLVGTGSKAALYRVTPTGEVTLLWRPEEGQVLALLRDGDSIVAATGNPGRVYRLSAAGKADAWIRLEPVDSGGSASWGRAIWEVLPGSGAWQLRTRSGYTDLPDSSWSEWSAYAADAEGSPIGSPPARFLQPEARFVPSGGGDPARLRRIWIPYSEPNLPPRLSAIRLSPEPASPAKDGQQDAGYSQDLGGGLRVEYQRTPPPSNGPEEDSAPPWVKEVRSIAWDVSDPNGDEVVFDVAIRQVGESRFRSLAREHPVPVYAIDTATLPDGSYEVRIIASDAPSNPPGEALSVSKIGGPIRVDHHPPEIPTLTVSRNGAFGLLVEGTARDDASPLQSLEISYDGQAWKPLGAVDGFIDSREEAFRAEIRLDREDEGTWLAARAMDAAGNEGVRRVWLAP